MKRYVPNGLSLLRLAIAGVITYLVIVPYPLLYGQILFSAGIVSDKLDGTLARAFGVESELGKKLESVVDPLFSLAAGVYVLRYTDIPLYFIVTASIFLLLSFAARIFLLLIGKGFFYRKSRYVRLGVAITYCLGLLFIFQLPYREYVLVPALVYGIIGWLIYMRMILQSFRGQTA